MNPLKILNLGGFSMTEGDLNLTFLKIKKSAIKVRIYTNYEEPNDMFSGLQPVDNVVIFAHATMT